MLNARSSTGFYPNWTGSPEGLLSQKYVECTGVEQLLENGCETKPEVS